MAAGIAFFAMLALFPGLTATISIYGYFSDPSVVKDNLGLLGPVLPEQVFELVNERVTLLITTERQALGLASLVSSLLATWSARAGITALISGLNVICREENTRNFVWNLVVAYALTLLLILVALLTLATVVVIPTIMAFVPLGPQEKALVGLVRWGVALTSVTLGIGALYRFGPSRRTRRLPWITVGTLFAVALWVIVSILFS
ncbi:MAG: YihY/virulence factor BrkB family protein, partial [Pseudomonadota bacterium]